MDNTASKNETNVEAPHSSNRLHLSDPMPVQGIVEGWPLSNPTLTRRRSAVRVGRVAIFRGLSGWGPHLKTGQVIVCEAFGRRFTGRVERFLNARTRTSRYHRGASTPVPSSYVVMIDAIEELAT